MRNDREDAFKPKAGDFHKLTYRTLLAQWIYF